MIILARLPSYNHSGVANMVHQQLLMNRNDKGTTRRLTAAGVHIELVPTVMKKCRKANRAKHAVTFSILHLGHKDHSNVVAETATIFFRIFCNKNA